MSQPHPKHGHAPSWRVRTPRAIGERFIESTLPDPTRSSPLPSTPACRYAGVPLRDMKEPRRRYELAARNGVGRIEPLGILRRQNRQRH
jgi:hypothetical protein